MSGFLPIIAVILVVAVLLYVFVNSSPAAIASSLRLLGPIFLCGAGVMLTLVGRAGIGMPLILFGAMMFARSRPISAGGSGSRQQTSTVRSAWLEMQLDHDTGDLDGIVLIGDHEGTVLSGMDGDTLLSLYADLSGDNESAALMEAYLDRRIPGWRESANANPDPGLGASLNTGPMTKQEAYQVLGLDPGAGAKEIRAAHRRLMKAVHPDSGGSTFLAARINQAKDTLLD